MSSNLESAVSQAVNGCDALEPFPDWTLDNEKGDFVIMMFRPSDKIQDVMQALLQASER